MSTDAARDNPTDVRRIDARRPPLVSLRPDAARVRVGDGGRLCRPGAVEPVGRRWLLRPPCPRRRACARPRARWRPSRRTSRRQAKSCIFLMMNGGPSHVDTFDYKPELGEVRRPAAAGRTSSSPTPATARWASSRRPGGQFRPGGQSGLMISDYFPARPRACRQAGPDPLLPHRQPCARLGAGGDEHRQHVHRPAVAGQLGRVRPGHGEPEPAGLRGDHGQARRADQRTAELVERLHAGQLPGDAVPAGRRAGARPARAASIARRSASSSTCWPS